MDPARTGRPPARIPSGPFGRRRRRRSLGGVAQHLMVDEVGFRFGLGGGLVFGATGALVAGGAPPDLGVAVLLAVTTVAAFVLDLRYALALGALGWAFATGFAVNSL